MIALKLLRIEWFKTWRRVAFWFTTAFILAMCFLAFGVRQIMHARGASRGPFQLPAEWSSALQIVSQFGMISLIVLIALLAGSERTWRTQRQNVIDGLSREQYFWGKVILIVMMALFVWALTIGNVLFYAALDGVRGSGSMFTGQAGAALGGLLLHLGLIAAIALAFSIVASSSGAAIAFSFLFLIASAPIGMALGFDNGLSLAIAERLPTQVLEGAINLTIYDPETLARVNGRRMGGPMLLPAWENNSWVVGYTAAFIGLAWLAFRRRDL